MIVDDSAEMRCLLREVVAPLTHQVVECADGLECLESFAVAQPDWTIMDVRMPRLDGLSTMRAVHQQWPQARVLIVTHFRSAAVVAAASEAGAIGCVSKDELFRLVEVMDGSAGGTDGSQPTPN